MDKNSQDKDTLPTSTSKEAAPKPKSGDAQFDAYDSETELILERRRADLRKQTEPKPVPSAQRVRRTESGTTRRPPEAIDAQTTVYDLSQIQKQADRAPSQQQQQTIRPAKPRNSQARPPVADMETKAMSVVDRKQRSSVPARLPASSSQKEPSKGATRVHNIVSAPRRTSQTQTPAGSKPLGAVVQNPSVNEPKEEAVELGKKSESTFQLRRSRKSRSADEGSATVLSLVWAIVYIILVIVVSVFLGFAIIFVGNDIFAFVKSDDVVTVEIPEYATLNEVTDIFYEEGLIKYKTVFKIWSQLRDKDTNVEFVAGSYELSPAMNYDELREEIRPKTTRGIVQLTIPEGYTTDEIIDMFVSNGIGTKEGFIEAINNYDFAEYDYWFIKELDSTTLPAGRIYRLDGYLFPDTYQFYTDSTEVAALSKLLDNFAVKFNEVYRERAAALNMTTDQLITLASMIEKEARYVADLPTVSSVFHNRLNNSANFPRLESDATIIYAIHHDTGTRPTSLASEQKSYDTPYNTYTNNGLPPGAIANPGLEAITYALYPSETSYYYFVSNSYGEIYFASTLSEQTANITKARADG